MKRVLIIYVFLLSTVVKAQVDYEKIILPEEISQYADFEEKLVQLAWKNYPLNQIVQSNEVIAEQNIQMAKMSWTRDIKAQFNLNEGNIDPPEDRQNLFYPRYNFQVNLPMSTFIMTPTELKLAKEKYKIATAEKNQQKLRIRREVLTKYQNYLMNQKILQIESEITEEEYAKYLLAEQQFKEGSIQINEYNESLREYNTQRMKKITAENALLTSKYAIEEMIGMVLEDIQ